jgi:two-component system, OmpR family, response regulator
MLHGMRAIGEPVRQSPLSGLHVVIIDDNEDVRGALCAALRYLGADVTEAASAAAARAALERAPADAILSDICMPDEDGCTFLAKLRTGGSAARNTPAAAVTASHAPEDHARAIASGFSFVIEKPFDLEGITRAVLRLCPNAQPRDSRQRS